MLNTVVLSIHFNRLEYSKICLNSYFEKVKTPHKLVIWNNGSKDGTTEFLKSVEADKELLKRLPFEVEFYFSDKNVRWADVINHVWSNSTTLERSPFKDKTVQCLGYCPSDMLITNDWVAYQMGKMQLVPNLAVVSDPISNRERQQPQEPYTYAEGTASFTEAPTDLIILKDKFGDVPLDCMPSLLRAELYRKHGPLVERGGMGALVFFQGRLRELGYLGGWTKRKCSELIMYHLLLSWEDTPKYRLYRDWLHKFKRNQLGEGQTPPPDMYKDLRVGG